ncbi:MAG TPA: zf-HC2 domain-containing protein [Thermomicrobiaceae bacterium]|nr:zf-HC2 domain-containing protein [Thermomicrobiaceae bacterium]
MVDDRTPPDDEHISDTELSDYLEGQVDSESRRRALAAHLEACGACRRALQELATLVDRLAALPLPEPPRSFRITAAMVPAPVALPTPWFIRLQPAMRWATAAAAVLLVLVVGADLVTHAGGAKPAATESSARPQTFTSSGSTAASTTTSATRPPTSIPAAGAAVQSSAASAAASPAPRTAAVTAGSTPAPETPVAAALPSTSAVQGSTASPSGWRIAELAIALVLLWLLVATVALPRLRRSGF